MDRPTRYRELLGFKAIRRRLLLTPADGVADEEFYSK
jgi:hypothetical protein